MKRFTALRVTESDGAYAMGIEERELDDLPEGEVLIKVQYSSLNFKDLLVCRGARGLAQHYPHTPGIDAAGIVEESGSGGFRPGDAVMVTGFDLGINTDGGFGEYIRVPAAWVQRIPEPFGPREVMAYGTAGLTAGLSVKAILDKGLGPDSGPVAVTGASGGVGSLAVGMLAAAGFAVTAITNKTDDEDRLRALGAERVIGSDTANEASTKQLLKPAWAAVVDTVGGTILAKLIKETMYGGVVTCCGMVAGNEMTVSVFPFILRAVRLVGIDSVLCPIPERDAVWELIARRWHDERLAKAYTEVGLRQLPQAIEEKTEGRLRGRILVRLRD